jgi:hypothetical protein
MILRKIKNISAAIVFFSAVFGLAFFVSQVQAGALDSGRGWLWGGGAQVGIYPPADGTNTNLGEIYIKSESTKVFCDTNNNGFLDVACGGLDTAATPFQSYGVNIPTANGLLTGSLGAYAWSENVGWISFNSVDIAGCPGGNCVSQRFGNTLTGWARILSIRDAGANAGGWLGWIKLSGTAQNGSTYGVGINANTLAGYAWSDELGWIDFSKVSIAKTITATLTASPALVANNTTPVSVTATITGGTASSNNITYDLDCANDGGIPNVTYSSTTGEITHTFSNACTYSASSTAAVKITRDGVSATPTALIVYGCIDSSVCNTTNYTCGTTIKAPGTCTNTCTTITCQRPRDLNWRETAPN